MNPVSEEGEEVTVELLQGDFDVHCENPFKKYNSRVTDISPTVTDGMVSVTIETDNVEGEAYVF